MPESLELFKVANAFNHFQTRAISNVGFRSSEWHLPTVGNIASDSLGDACKRRRVFCKNHTPFVPVFTIQAAAPRPAPRHQYIQSNIYPHSVDRYVALSLFNNSWQWSSAACLCVCLPWGIDGPIYPMVESTILSEKLSTLFFV
jgi:hypothetical protein